MCVFIEFVLNSGQCVNCSKLWFKYRHNKLAKSSDLKHTQFANNLNDSTKNIIKAHLELRQELATLAKDTYQTDHLDSKFGQNDATPHRSIADESIETIAILTALWRQSTIVKREQYNWNRRSRLRKSSNGHAQWNMETVEQLIGQINLIEARIKMENLTL